MYRYHTVKKAISRFQGKKLILKTNEEINQEFKIISFINKHVTIRRFLINVFFQKQYFQKFPKAIRLILTKHKTYLVKKHKTTVNYGSKVNLSLNFRTQYILPVKLGFVLFSWGLSCIK